MGETMNIYCFILLFCIEYVIVLHACVSGAGTDVAVLAKKVANLEKEIYELKETVSECRRANGTKKRYLLTDNLENGPVAFSAYVTNYQSGLSSHKIIQFDGVLLNDGNAYNNHTGVFTVPVSGVYLVSYFIADRDVNQVFVQLTVDNVEISMACAETVQSRHIDQGGNTAILHLTKGQNMWVEVNTGNAHIESHEVWRFTTFSAVLLYEQ